MYSTDVTDAQWDNIKRYLDTTGRRRKFSLRSVWNALMYVVKTGCQWWRLPLNFPKWQLVYYYYCKWVDAEFFDRMLESLAAKPECVRVKSHVRPWGSWTARAFAGATTVASRVMMAIRK